MRFQILYTTAFITATLISCNPHQKKSNRITVSHIYGATGDILTYTVTDSGIVVSTNCDGSNCKEDFLYNRTLNPSESGRFFQRLVALKLDTLQELYDPANVMDGHYEEVKIEGALLPTKLVAINNTHVPAIDSVHEIVDCLIDIKKFRFGHYWDID